MGAGGAKGWEGLGSVRHEKEACRVCRTEITLERSGVQGGRPNRSWPWDQWAVEFSGLHAMKGVGRSRRLRNEGDERIMDTVDERERHSSEGGIHNKEMSGSGRQSGAVL